jgi:hypothetical protein
MQYKIITLNNFQAGIKCVTRYVFLTVAVYLFKTYLIKTNWHLLNYASRMFASMLGLLWILVFYDIGGLRQPYFTIFIDLDQVSL